MKKVFFFLLALQVYCVFAGTPARSKVVLFDRAHGELFGPTGSQPLDYSVFANLFKKSGYTIRTQTDSITERTLDAVSVLVVSGAFKDLTPSEVAAVTRFIESGGNVLVLLHVSAPVARLTEKFGIIVSNATVFETERESQIEEKPYNFSVRRFQTHPIFVGVKRMAVYGSWALMCEGVLARSLATTSPKAFADVTQNKRYDSGDPIQSFTIVAAAEKGSGKILVVADDAAFSNAFIEEADNLRVGSNIVQWLTSANKR